MRASCAPPRRRGENRRSASGAPRRLLGAPLAAIPEMAVEAAAGAGAAGEEFAAEKARWYLPEGMIRHEGDAEPGNLRVLRARGDSMEPLVSDGDRLLVDVTRRTAGTGEMAVLWDGTGLVVKRVEVLPNAEPPRLRLISANPAYEPYTCLAQDAHIVGKVLWTLRRMCRRRRSSPMVAGSRSTGKTGIIIAYYPNQELKCLLWAHQRQHACRDRPAARRRPSMPAHPPVSPMRFSPQPSSGS